MTDFSRRKFLGAAGAGIVAGGVASNVKLKALAAKAGAPLNTTDRVITIFLRGAQDGVHTVVPVGDPGLATARAQTTSTISTVQMPSAPTNTAFPNGFAQINSDYSLLVSGAGNPDAAGHAAWIHQVGNPSGTRSHFTEQQIYETADVQPQVSLNPEGFLARLQLEAAPPNTPLWGASVSSKMQRMFRSTSSTKIMAHVKSIAEYDSLPPVTSLYNAPPHPYVAGFIPPRSEQQLKIALNNLHLPQAQPAGIADYLRETALFAELSEAQINGVSFAHDGTAFPTSSADPGFAALSAAAQSAPQFTFMRRCEQAMQIAKQTSCQVVGIEIGGWDTHNDQNSRRSKLDPWLARAIRSLYDATVNEAETYTILVITEFGRTSFDNSSSPSGTDHGIGALMMAFGPQVNGGLYHCHPASLTPAGQLPWENLATGTFAANNAQNVATDFRAIYWELLQKRFNLTGAAGTASLMTIIPGFTPGATGPTALLGCIN